MRPTRRGCDYFNVDTEFDSAMEAHLSCYGNDAAMFWLRLWQACYRDERGEMSYHALVTRDGFERRCNCTKERIDDMISAAFDVDLLDREAYETRQVLTSRGIQRRLECITQAREKSRERQARARAERAAKSGHALVTRDERERHALSRPKEKKRKVHIQVCTDLGSSPEKNALASERGRSLDLDPNPANEVSKSKRKPRAERPPAAPQLRELFSAEDCSALVKKFGEARADYLMSSVQTKHDENSKAFWKKYKSPRAVAISWDRWKTEHGFTWDGAKYVEGNGSRRLPPMSRGDLSRQVAIDEIMKCKREKEKRNEPRAIDGSGTVGAASLSVSGVLADVFDRKCDRK